MAETFVITSDSVDPQLTRDLHAACLKPPTKTLANGSVSNNHLDLGFEETPSRLRDPILAGLADLVTRIEAEVGLKANCFVPVPNGANGWVESLNGLFLPEREVILFQKLNRREFQVLDATEITELDDPLTAIVFDDATTDGGTTEAMADHLESTYNFNVIAAVSIYYRGRLSDLTSKYNRAFLIAKHIPLFVDMEHHKVTGDIRPLNLAN